MPNGKLILEGAEEAAKLAAHVPGLSELVPEGLKAVDRAATAASAALKEHGFPDAASVLTGEVKGAHFIKHDPEPGMTLKEFHARWNAADMGEHPYRVKQVGETTGWFIGKDLLANRVEGQVGRVRGYIAGHGDLHFVEHIDGTHAPYRVNEEMEPLVVKPELPADHSVKVSDRRGPLADLKVGDTLMVGKTESGEYVKGVQADWEPSNAYVEARHDRLGFSVQFPAKTLDSKDGAFLVGKDGLPSGVKAEDAAIGDKISAPDHHQFPGTFTIEERQFEAPVREMYLGEFKVDSIDGDKVRLTDTDKRGWDKADTRILSLSDMREPLFRRLEDLNVKPGDKLVAPLDGAAPNYYDWQYKANMRGHTWTVGGEHPNGVLLNNGDRSVVVPHSYMNTRTFLPQE